MLCPDGIIPLTVSGKDETDTGKMLQGPAAATEGSVLLIKVSQNCHLPLGNFQILDVVVWPNIWAPANHDRLWNRALAKFPSLHPRNLSISSKNTFMGN